MLDKNNRVAALVPAFGEMLGAADDMIVIAKRAAELAKADLATQMVVELTSLQGTMGCFYAQIHGETPEVAIAILEHWLPRGAGDKLPSSAAGVLLALLDRLDSLVGLFAVGLEPVGASDPYALRRAALGVIQILLDRRLTYNLRGAVALVADQQPTPVTDEQQNAVIQFIAGRFEGLLLEQGHANDVVKAVLAEQAHNPARALAAIRRMSQAITGAEWEAILDNSARCPCLPAPWIRFMRLKPLYWCMKRKSPLWCLSRDGRLCLMTITLATFWVCSRVMSPSSSAFLRTCHDGRKPKFGLIVWDYCKPLVASRQAVLT